MKRKYIIPESTPIACHTDSLLATSPSDGLDVGGQADDGFVELSREEEDHSSMWDDWE